MLDGDSLLSSVRDRLAVVDQRRDALRQELAALDLERDRLASAVSVIQEHVGPAMPAPSSGDESPVPLTDRVLAALSDGGSRRAELVARFVGSEVTIGSLDSALHRLTVRGLIRREGRRMFRVHLPAAAVGDTDSAVPAVGVQDNGPVVSARVGVPTPAPDSGVDGPSDGALARSAVAGDTRFLTERVHDAIARGYASTRKELVKYFGPQGVKPTSVDEALRGLRKRGAIQRDPAGQITVSQ